MFRNTFQKGFLSVFYSIGSNPLLIWKTQTKNGYIKRVTDEDLNSMALEIVGSNMATAYIVTPIHPRESLAIKLPFIVLIIKNMNKSFSFEVQILDDQNVLRRFRVSNCHNSTKINSFSTAMPIVMSDGWNQIQFNLADFTRRAYNTAYVETVRIQIHANVRIRRIFFSDRIYTDDEKPEQYRLFLPKERVAKKSEKTNKPPTTPKTERNDYCVDTCNQPCAYINPS
ncbi:cilia- and flagella-associated protein 20-like [Bradysia coprophila]|uniref:cilia- and flagella-associated protein 20-like n=1 Tax=Bradysia coprophila TaxID=38358 RepID=UPI00187D7855|nr:cilia- and flagella-associated protein 20-like [Bradysia coprophila]